MFKFKYELHVYKRETNEADNHNPNKWLTITRIKTIVTITVSDNNNKQ